MRGPGPAPEPPGGHPAPIARVLSILGAAALALLVFVFLYAPLRDPDLWWHLKSGWTILTEGAVPRTNTFAQAADTPWIDHQWGFQVLLYMIWRAAGPQGLVALKVVVGGACWLLAARLAAPRGKFLALLPPLAIGVVASSERMLARPEIFSFLFFVIQLALLMRWRKRPSAAPLFGLIGIQILWANFHALAVLGVIAVIAFLAGEAAGPRRGENTLPSRELPPPGRRDLLALLVTGIACAAALSATPYGIAGALHPFTLLGQLDNPQIAIAEFQSPFSDFRVTTAIRAFHLFAALLGAVVLFTFPRVDRSLLLLTVALFALSATARRNVPFFVLAALPLIGVQFAVLAERLRRVVPGAKIRRAAGVVVAMVMIGAMIFVARDAAGGRFYARDGLDKRFGGGVDRTALVKEAIDYAMARNLKGTVFNDIDTGGYFIWRAFPKRRAFIDSRLEAVPPSRLLAYSRAVRTAEGWRALDANVSFDYVLLDHTVPVNARLIARLTDDPAWALVHLDPRGLVFLRRESAPATLLDEDEIATGGRPPPRFRWPETPPGPLAQAIRKALAVEAVPDLRPALAYGAILLRLGFIDQAEGPIDEALARDPDSADALLLSGLLAEMRGMRKDALAIYGKVLEMDPRSIEALYNRDRLLHAKNHLHPGPNGPGP